MEILFKKVALNCLLLFMAVRILNQSFDAIYFQPIIINNAIGDFNDINSATEYISEVILGNKDAFPEFQESRSDQHKASQSFKHSNIKVFQPVAVASAPLTYITVLSFTYPLDETYSFLFSKDITPPPPKQV